ncbi:hypothetical protein HDU93_007363 [Gonapodya sp. JEL0774]|nr:hypothetical protein HDU93_007363 [Gonapodya sp. JEL0774]
MPTPTKKRKGAPSSQATLDRFFSPSKVQKLEATSSPRSVSVDISKGSVQPGEPFDVDELDTDVDELDTDVSILPASLKPSENEDRVNGNVDPKASSQEHVTIGVHTSPATQTTHSVKVSLQSYNAAALPHYWKTGEPVPFGFLANALRSISQDKSRIATSDALANVLRSVLFHRPTEILPSVYLLSGSVAPSYEGVELGVGGQVVVKAAREVSGVSAAEVKRLFDEKGDLGDVVMEMKVKQTTLFKLPPLTVPSLFNGLQSLALLKGSGSQSARQQRIQRLFSSAQGEELRWLARILTGNLRAGTLKLTLLGALAKAVVAHRQWDKPLGGQRTGTWNKVAEQAKEMEAVLRGCWSVCPNFDLLIPVLVDPNSNPLTLCTLIQPRLQVPIRPMLGKITKDLTEALEKLEGWGPYVADWKYDGQRAQMHWEAGGVAKIFSRHLEDSTGKFPDVISILSEVALPTTTSFILDTEVVAIDPETGKNKPFQVLANRPKNSVGGLVDLRGVAVCVYPFDLLYLNGESLLKTPLRERIHLLQRSFTTVPHRFELVKKLIDPGPDEVADFLTDALSAGAEGLMLKLLDEPTQEKRKERGALLATYEPVDRRSDSWLKVKKDYSDSFRTFDLVVIGAWWGSGRKAGWYSPFLLACRNPATDRYESVCKVMSGFSDEFYREQLNVFSQENGNVLSARPNYYEVDDRLTPDMWFEPQQIAARGLAKSDSDRGVSIRFPRFAKVRTDKGLEDVTTSEEIADAYSKQPLVRNALGILGEAEPQSTNIGTDVADGKGKREVDLENDSESSPEDA